MISYKLRLTPNKKLWDELTLYPPKDLRDLMKCIKMYAQMAEVIRQAE